MNTEMARFGFEVVLVLKGIFALAALLNVIVLAIWVYKSMSKMRKIHFWLACIFAVFAILWVTTMHILLAYPHLAKMIPQPGWNVLIFGSLTPAFAAGLTMGLHSNETSAPQIQSI